MTCLQSFYVNVKWTFLIIILLLFLFLFERLLFFIPLKNEWTLILGGLNFYLFSMAILGFNLGSFSRFQKLLYFILFLFFGLKMSFIYSAIKGLGPENSLIQLIIIEISRIVLFLLLERVIPLINQNENSQKGFLVKRSKN